MELGRYRLEEQVGQGGMAVVWRGWDTQLRRTVAVKVLHAHLHAREEIRKRFDREAHAVARLHHPFILDVYDFSGPQADPSYLVTEFIRGTTLRAFADAHAFDPPELALVSLLPIAEALQHAHAAGVVHRDLKPENIMVRDDGVVKLTDFGIAALLDPDEKFTVTGSILGSPAHLAPETIEGKAADPRADLFSFGTILYWLSCGKLPYQANSPAALLRSILEGTREDPRTVRPSISDAQAKIIARCLENDPARRYQSAAEVKLDIEEALREAGIEDPVRELAAFVRSPAAQAEDVRMRLIARALAAGEDHLARKRTSAALAAFGRALALDPQNATARGRVERIRRRERMLALARRAAIALAAAVALVAGVWQVRDAIQRARKTAADARAAQVKIDADRAARERAEAEARARAVPPVQPPVQPPLETTVRRPAPPPRPPEPLEVELRTRFGGQIEIDHRPIRTDNSSPTFKLKLLPGTHDVIVRHACCMPGTQQISVTRNRPEQVYQLEYGPPLAAQFRVINAPPDARVLIDSGKGPVLVGTAADPRPYTMDQLDQQVTVSIGDRTLALKIRAGMVNLLDYAKGTP
ncbi:MAG TPA: serine/threonine-protein kinase [Myxococcales bacterium]|nr:serine/threonine-protein kinase [Myxococcales bacterium]